MCAWVCVCGCTFNKSFRFIIEPFSVTVFVTADWDSDHIFSLFSVQNETLKNSTYEALSKFNPREKQTIVLMGGVTFLSYALELVSHLA